nr:zinc-binding dehydrogenase [uncultured Mediterraneibacter sp.]
MKKKGKLAACAGYYKMEIQEHPIPEPLEDGLVIKVEAAAVCGGDQGFIQDKSDHTPGCMGHEFAGRIISMGPKAKEAIHCYGGELEIGARIVVYPWVTCGKCDSCMTYGDGVCGVCDNGFFYGGVFRRNETTMNHDPQMYPYFKGGFGEYVYIYANTYVWRIPDEMPSKIAALLDPLAVAVRGVEQTMTSMGGLNEGFSTTSTVLIVGPGAIGILTGLIYKYMGCERLIFTGRSDEKLKRAQEITNADDIVNVKEMTVEERVATIREMTHGGANIVINCANNQESCIEALQMVRKLGTYVEIGNAMSEEDGKKVEIDLADVVFSRNAHITSVVANSPKSFDRAFRLLKKYKEIPFEKVITHEFHTLEELLPHLKKMKDVDYVKSVLIFEEDSHED